MTTLIEKLEALTNLHDHTLGLSGFEQACLIQDLRAIIEEHKRESGEAVAVVGNAVAQHTRTGRYNTINTCLPSGTKLYTSPQPSNTQLIGELLAALESNRRCLVNPSMREEYDCAFGEIMKKAREAVK